MPSEFVSGFSRCRRLLTPLCAFWACGGLEMPLKMWSVTSLVLASPLFPAVFAAALLLYKTGLTSLIWVRGYAEAFIKAGMQYLLPTRGRAAWCPPLLHPLPRPRCQPRAALGDFSDTTNKMCPWPCHTSPPFLKGREHQPCSLYPSGEGTGKMFRRGAGRLLPCFDPSQ